MDRRIDRFQRYTRNIEAELELLIFSMFDLIDTKVRTLRKLMKFHMHIKYLSNLSTLKAARTSRDKLKEPKPHYGLKEKESEEMFSLMASEMNSVDASDVRTSDFKDSSSEDGEILKEAITFDEYYVNQSTVKSEERPNAEHLLTIPDESKLEVKQVANVQQGKEDQKEEPNEKKVKGDESSCRPAEEVPKELDAAVGPSEVEMKEGPSLEVPFSDGQPKSEMVDTETSSGDENETESVIDEPSMSVNSEGYVVVAALEGTLNSLHDCRPGDSGIYVDENTFKNVVDILQTVLNTCCMKKRCNVPPTTAQRRSSIEKCNTQPVLKVKGDTALKRMACSVTNCDRYLIKN